MASLNSKRVGTFEQLITLSKVAEEELHHVGHGEIGGVDMAGEKGKNNWLFYRG